jgi:hypothetical protein
MDKSIIKLVRNYEGYYKHRVHWDMESDKNGILGKVMNTLTYEEFMPYFWMNKYIIITLTEIRMRVIMNAATHREKMKMLGVAAWYIEYLDRPNYKQLKFALSRHWDNISGVNPAHVPDKLLIHLFEATKHQGYLNPIYYIKPIPTTVENYIIDKDRDVDIYRFSFESQKKAVTKNHKYLILCCDMLLDENAARFEELLNYAIDHGVDTVKKLCEHFPMYGLGKVFRLHRLFSRDLIKKCICSYPKCVGHFRKDNDLLIDAIRMDGRAIKHSDEFPSYDLCLIAIRSNPKAIKHIIKKEKYWPKSRAKNPEYTKELHVLKHLAIELDPDLVYLPDMQTKELKVWSSQCKKRRRLNLMMTLCFSLHELCLPDLILFCIFDHWCENHGLIDHDLWNITRIVKRQEIKI